MGAEKPEVILECGLKYTLVGPDAQPSGEDRATARLTAQDLELLPTSGPAKLFGLREIVSLDAADYRLVVRLSSGENLSLFHIGPRYNDFCRELSRLRHELAIEDLLMQEQPVAGDFRGRYARRRSGGGAAQGTCGIRLYETALLVLPQTGDLERVPYSFIAEVRPEDFKIKIEVEDDGVLVLSQLGPHMDPLRRTLLTAIGDLAVTTQRYLQELLPQVEPSAIRRAAPLLRDGRAARRVELDMISPALWTAFEEKIAGLGMGPKYAFLRSLSLPEEICVGMKRGLMGDLTGDYIWVLFPVYDPDSTRPGNAVALEAASPAGTGRATYFFRISGRREYPQLAADPEQLRSRAAVFCRELNRWLLAINFRRQPVYLAEKRLREPRYERYFHALQRIPELRLLRERFIGRVINSSPEQWRRDVCDLLRFNVSAAGDELKWLSPTGTEDGGPAGDDEEGIEPE